MDLPKVITESDPFAKAVPGSSLTGSPGKWPWERPPQFTDPDDAIEYILDQVEQPRATERYTKLMIAGVSIEEIVNSIAIAGFQEGFYNPDVAELIKMPLTIYFMDMAEKNEIMVNVFATADGGPAGFSDETLDEGTLLEIMSRRNPKVFNEVIGTYRARPQEEAEMEEPEQEVKVPTQGGFMEVEIEMEEGRE